MRLQPLMWCKLQQRLLSMFRIWRVYSGSKKCPNVSDLFKENSITNYKGRLYPLCDNMNWTLASRLQNECPFVLIQSELPEIYLFQNSNTLRHFFEHAIFIYKSIYTASWCLNIVLMMVAIDTYDIIIFQTVYKVAQFMSHPSPNHYEVYLHCYTW